MKKANVVLSCAVLFAAAPNVVDVAFGQGFGGYSAPVGATSRPVPVAPVSPVPSNGSLAPSSPARPVSATNTNAAPNPNAAFHSTSGSPAVAAPAPTSAFVAQRFPEPAPQNAAPNTVPNATVSAQNPGAFGAAPGAASPRPTRTASPQGATSASEPAQGGVLSNAAIQSAIVPPPSGYKLTESEQAKLDEFLNHWENFGKGIKRISCDVHMKEFDGGLLQQDAKKPILHTWGLFRFIAPNKLQYRVKGEFSYAEEGEPVWKDGQNEWEIVLDGKSLTQYDYKNKKAVVYPIPEDEQNIDLSMDNGQFPLFFIAKSELLKNRFYMRLVTPQAKRQSEVWIEAFPRYARDAQQFRSIVVILSLKDMQPTYMRKNGVNGKSKTDLMFENVTVNKGRWDVEGKVDPTWVKDVRDEEFSLIQQQPLETSVAQRGARATGATSGLPSSSSNGPIFPGDGSNIAVVSAKDAAKNGLARTAENAPPAGKISRAALNPGAPNRR